eukprot:NODE_14_length_42432_cov_0.433799.p6 type:complete len:591 gc:universal NODE_14_length_42432_cov_0.433799:7469-5697(-)
MDAQLITLVNQLQDALGVITNNPIDLPQITVIGSQSSGKSSVLENIVGRDFLPRGSGIVTRRPLVLQLIHSKEEYGMFLHTDKKFTDFDEIRKEIIAETDRACGSNTGISPIPINLRVFSPNVLNLTLVDLPGITKVPVGDQPIDIESQIRNMLVKFISRPNAIILAVTAANTDLANSDGLKLAREVDPEGLRTIGVLTKIDLMDKDTDVIDVLAGRVIPLRLGYVPVINRGQKDINQKKSIKLALEDERKYFENHPSYGNKSQYCGTGYLAKKLNLILMHHIKATLPDTKAKIQQQIIKCTTELQQLGDPIKDDEANILLQILTDLARDFKNVLDGTSEVQSDQLSGGARIAYVFHEWFAAGVRDLDPFDKIKDGDIRTILYNSSGSQPSLFVGTQAFEVLVKQQIERLRSPSLKCVGLVYDEILRILTHLLNNHPAFKRFPALKDRIYNTILSFLNSALKPTNKLVEDLISSEACYINTAHPDFINGHKATAMVQERMLLGKQSIVNDATYAAKSAIGRQEKVKDATTIRQEEVLKGGTPENSGWFGGLFGSKKKTNFDDTPPPPSVIRAQGQLNEREILETEVISNF